MSAEHADHHVDHTGLYWKIGGILAVITILEVIYPYATESIVALNPFYMPILGVMSVVKFVIVCGFFMHLKFDPPWMTKMFAFSLLIATGFMTAFVFLFHVV